jgi:hypothetical protein
LGDAGPVPAGLFANRLHTHVQAVPIHLKQANVFVGRHHRHSLPTVGGKFAIGVEHEGKLVGVAIAGRPVARRLDDGKTLEVLRVCTDGTPNANSFLYGRVKKIARLMGYERIITYRLQEESGASLKAVGAKIVGEVQPKEWSVPSRRRKSQEVYGKAKWKWEL